MKQHVRCRYLKDCYLAEDLECFGFRTDCPLYMKSNGEPCNEARFHAAMDRLIMSTKAKHDRLKRSENTSHDKPQSTHQKTPAE